MKTNRTAQWLLATTIILGAVGCSSNNTLPGATVRSSITTNVDNYNYLVGPGDVLNIFVWRHADISGSFSVRPDGMITTSLVEDIPVSGRTTTQLARQIEEELGKFIRDPIVSVSVSRFIGPFSEQVRVIGEASSPQAINYTEDMSLLDLMIQVGGITEFADGNGAKLIRTVEGQQREYSIRLDDLIKDGDISSNVDILPGDIVIIPEAWF